MTQVERLARSPLFSERWYVERCPSASADPVRHYVEDRGRRRDPHPLFATSWYLERYPDARGWPTPLHHFFEVSAKVHLDPHPLFDSSSYVERYGAGSSSVTPVERFLLGPTHEEPHPLFSNAHYLQQLRRPLPEGVTPVEHYLTWGAARGLSPSPLVDLADLRARLGPTGTLDPLSFVLGTTALGRSSDLPLPAHPTGAVDGRDIDAHDADWRWEYLVEEQWRWPETFELYRIIGNDLPPRHRHGQSLDNVRFILEHEPELTGCTRRWVVNRIIEPGYERKIIDLLEEHEQDFIVIPFRVDEYREAGWRFQDFDQPGLTMGRRPPGVTRHNHHVAMDHLYHDKNLYVMNNNGARNVALREGSARATWVLPFDGNCFFTEEAWSEVRSAVLAAPHLRYFAVPMARLTDNLRLRDPTYRPRATEEPQLAFRWDAVEWFDEGMRYGRRSKVDLLYRLGIPGPWDGWTTHRWEPDRPVPGVDAGRWASAGWVARLFSGQAELERSSKQRATRRIEAVRDCLDRIDESIVRSGFAAGELLVLSERVLAEQAELARAGDPVLTAYVRCLRDTADGYLIEPSRQDPGGRGDGTREGRGARDSTLRDVPTVFRAIFVLSLAGHLTQEERYLTRAARYLETRVCGSGGRPSGARMIPLDEEDPPALPLSADVRDLRDLHYVLDAARLLERAGALDPSRCFVPWLSRLRTRRHSDPEGVRARQARDHRGTWYDVQDLAICAYLDDVRGMLDALRRSEERIYEQFTPDGRQRNELVRDDSLHGHAFNLQGFLLLAEMADAAGQDLWSAEIDGVRRLPSGTRRLLSYIEGAWPFPQAHTFDHDRLVVLACHARLRSPAVDSPWSDPSRAWSLRPMFASGTGIRPFWQLGMPGLVPDHLPTTERLAS